MLRWAILQPNALPARMAIVTAPPLSAGSAPGSPRHTGHTCVLGGAPNAVEQPQKILLLVRSCAWTSRPITGSQSARGIRGLPDLHGYRARLGAVHGEAGQPGRAVRREAKLQHHSLGRLLVLRVAEIGDSVRRGRHDIFAVDPCLVPE